MSSESDAQPGRLVTANQIVAWNLAWYRRAAGMKQREIEEKLGWRDRRVSEAERSWDSGRTFEFDAQILADLTAVLGIPVAAFFIPPDGADGDCLYPAPGGNGTRPAGALLADVIFGGEDDFSEIKEAFRQRLEFSATRYLEPDWAQRVGKMLSGEMDQGPRDDLAARLRTRAQQLMDAAADFAEVAESIAPMGGGADAGAGQ